MDEQRVVQHTRMERRLPVASLRIVVLKLDHLGDFILGLPAMERLRRLFPRAHITLVCGAWNLAAARGLGLFDAVVEFGAFPQRLDQGAWPERAVLVERLREVLVESFDLAIDLRVDDDTRDYLCAVNARLRAGVGTRSRFGFLDVFLPIDATRAQPPPASLLAAAQFSHAAQCQDLRFAIAFEGCVTAPESLVFGPYLRLPLGHYRLRPFIEVSLGEISCEVVIDDCSLWSGPVGSEITFFNPVPMGHFQFRLTRSETDPACAFRFFGGELTRDAVSDGLHQSEYLQLLVELVAMRVHSGILTEVPLCRV